MLTSLQMLTVRLVGGLPYMELNAFMKYLGERRRGQNLVCENSSKWPQIAHLPKNKQRCLPSLYFTLSFFLLSTNDVILKKI